MDLDLFESDGCHEVEVEEIEGTVESSATLSERKCRKHPGHHTFIPASSFTVHHLPAALQSGQWLNFIRLLCQRTVKISRTVTSHDRPRGFVQSDYRGKTNMTFSGTGFISAIHEEHGQCECAACDEEPDLDHVDWYRLRIHTASHVLFNQEEVESAKIMLFFDDESNKSQVVTLPGWRMLDSICSSDVCVFECVINSSDLFKRLDRMLRSFEKLWCRLRMKLPPGCQNSVFLVSHPHGKAKHISIGKWLKSPEKDAGRERSGKLVCLTYDAPTCQGSSGAQVCDFWRGGQDGRTPEKMYFGLFVHSRDLGRGVNQSSHWWRETPAC